MMKTLILAIVKSQIHVMTVYFERKAVDLLLFHFAAFYCVDNCSALCLLSVSGQAFSSITLYPEHTSTLFERGKKASFNS